MNTKSKIKEFLSKHNQTDDGMKAIWDELAKISETANCIYKSVEQNWQKIPLHLLEESLTAKEKILAKREEEERKKIEQQTNQQIKEQSTRYYEEHFEEIILKKIENKEKLTAKDVEWLVNDDNFYIETVVIDKYDWTELVNTIIKLGDKYYSVYWQRALTENQENFFESQLAIEVEKRAIETYSWVEVKGEENG